MAVKFSGGVSPNVLIVGAVSGFALYLIWDFTRPDGPGGGSASTWKNNMEKAADALPLSGAWWMNQVVKAAESLPNLNPTSDKNAVYGKANEIARQMPGADESDTLGTWLYNITHPNEQF